MGEIKEYAYPFQDMWPSFWLKAAATGDHEPWRLCIFSLSGRWSNDEPVMSISTRTDTLLVVSQGIEPTVTG